MVISKDNRADITEPVAGIDDNCLSEYILSPKFIKIRSERVIKPRRCCYMATKSKLAKPKPSRPRY